MYRKNVQISPAHKKKRAKPSHVRKTPLKSLIYEKINPHYTSSRLASVCWPSANLSTLDSLLTVMKPRASHWPSHLIRVCWWERLAVCLALLVMERETDQELNERYERDTHNRLLQIRKQEKMTKQKIKFSSRRT